VLEKALAVNYGLNAVVLQTQNSFASGERPVMTSS
jgi:hypothetical protein